MSQVRAESPGEEYERRVAERRATVRAALTGVIGFSAWLHVFGLASATLAVLDRAKDLWVIVAILWGAAIVLAAVSALTCVKNIRLLTAGLALLGAVPWLALLVELTAFVALVLFRVIR